MTSVGAERTKKYKGHTLRAVDWYFVARRDSDQRDRFTATTIDWLKDMIDVADHYWDREGERTPCCTRRLKGVTL